MTFIVAWHDEDQSRDQYSAWSNLDGALAEYDRVWQLPSTHSVSICAPLISTDYDALCVRENLKTASEDAGKSSAPLEALKTEVTELRELIVKLTKWVEPKPEPVIAEFSTLMVGQLFTRSEALEQGVWQKRSAKEAQCSSRDASFAAHYPVELVQKRFEDLTVDECFNYLGDLGCKVDAHTAKRCEYDYMLRIAPDTLVSVVHPLTAQSADATAVFVGRNGTIVIDGGSAPITEPVIERDADFYIHACREMERYAEKAGQFGGGFMSAYALTLQHLATAYYRADLSNQRKLRQQFAPVFDEFHADYLARQAK